MRWQWSRLALLVACALPMLALTSCAELQRREMRSMARDYLDAEVKMKYTNQMSLYNQAAQSLLYTPYNNNTNPLLPAYIAAYTITGVALEGKTSRVDFKATVEVKSGGGGAYGFYGTVKPGDYDLSLYYVDERGRWAVDEIKTRAEWVAKLKGQQYSDLWLQQLDSMAATRGR